MGEQHLDLSVIIPLYNEEGNIPALFARLSEVLEKSGYTWELIFVDDGSRDGSLNLLQKFKEGFAGAGQIQIVQLSRNFGQHPATVAGFSLARGRVLLALDADLQIDAVNGADPALSYREDLGQVAGLNQNIIHDEGPQRC